MITASQLVRHCGYRHVLKRARKVDARAQAKMDRGTMFHKLVELWGTGQEVPPRPEDGDTAPWDLLEYFTQVWTPPPGCHFECVVGIDEHGQYVETVEDPPGSHQYIPNPRLAILRGLM